MNFGQVMLILLLPLIYFYVVEFCILIVCIWFFISGNTAQSPLCNYLQYNLYDQAEKLRSKAPRFEAHSSQQVIHLLYYICCDAAFGFTLF
jgi:hypothetical protein